MQVVGINRGALFVSSEKFKNLNFCCKTDIKQHQRQTYTYLIKKKNIKKK